MNKSYKEIYDELIGKKFQMAIIGYSPFKGVYEYRGYSHQADKNALEDIVNLIIDDMVFYAFSEDEILKLNEQMDLLKDLRAAAQYAYVQRLPGRKNDKTDGIMGEVLLDIFIQMASPNTKKLTARAKHTEIKSKKEITGYDALYFIKENTEISLWLGQAKAGQKKYCKDNIIKDLNAKYTKDYFADTVFYIADRNDAPELEELLCEINKRCLEAQLHKWSKKEKVEKVLDILKTKQVKIKIPCLISYSRDIYSDKKKLKQYVQLEVQEIKKEFDSKTFLVEMGLDYEIIFYIMPVENVDFIRNKIIELKEDAI